MPRVYECIARAIVARNNCQQNGNTEWHTEHTNRIERLIRDHLPHGSGFDNGTSIDWTKSTGERLIFNTAFHHMDEHGSYCGWSDHSVIVNPSLCYGFDVRVTGRGRRGIKEYIGDAFHSALDELLDSEY
jgi:hypothetical protein